MKSPDIRAQKGFVGWVHRYSGVPLLIDVAEGKLTMDEFITSLLGTITENIARHKDFDNFICVFVDLVKSKETYLNVFMNSSNHLPFVERLKEAAVPLLLTAFRVSHDNVTARYALEFYISGMIPLIGTWLKRNQDLSTEALAQLIKGILQDGVLKQVTG